MDVTVTIDDAAVALGIARTALKAQAQHATIEVQESVFRFKDPELAAIWAKNAARYGLAYLALVEAKFL